MSNATDRDPPSTRIDPVILEDNLVALRSVDPRLADRIAATSIDTATPVLGRDGSATYRLRRPDGTMIWFGRTSMPTVSGPALLESFRDGDANVVLPGIGQGIEAALLTGRISPHRAVFVLEPDPLCIALAMRLHRLADAIRQSQLVFITDDALDEGLTAFLVEHVGYVIPDRILARPWMTQAELDAFRGIVERTGQAAIQRRAASVTAIERALNQPCTTGERPRIVGLALAPDEETARRAADLAAVADSVGVDWRHCIPDTPAHGHVLAQLHAVAEHQPEFTLLLDHVRGDLPGVFPADRPVVSWLDAPPLNQHDLAARVGPTDRVCATSPHLARQLAAAGVEQDFIRVVPTGTVPVASSMREVPDAYRCDIAIFADGADLTPARWGIRLDSHTAVYHALVEALRHDADRFCVHDAERYLTQVESKLHLELEAGEVRNVMRRQIEQVIGPTTCRLAVVRELVAAGIRVHLYGRGWETHHGAREVRQPPIHDVGTERLALAGCRLVVHVDPTGRVPRQVFGAAALDRPALVRRHPYDAEDGGLETLLEPAREVLTFSSAREAAALALRILSDPEAAAHLAAAARSRVETDHSLAGRLERIQQFMKQVSVTQPAADHASALAAMSRRNVIPSK